MKLVFIIDHLRPDGAQHKLRDMATGFAKRGITSEVICLNNSWNGELLEEFARCGTPVHIIGKWPLVFGFGLLQVFRILNQGKFDIAVTMLFASDVIGRPISRISGVKKIITSVETRDEFYSPLQRLAVSLTSRFSDISVLCSSHLADFVARNEGIPVDKTRVIFNGIKASKFRIPTSKEDLRAKLNVPVGKFVIGSIGRLTHQKGLDVLLAALGRLDKLDFLCLIVGEGEDAEALKEAANRLNLSDRVIFTGFRSDVPEILGSLDLYVQPSRYEGMPLAVLEAMASALPIVASAVDGTQELIIDGQHGLLTVPDDPTGLMVAIRTLHDNQSLAARLGLAAQRRVLESFDESIIHEHWIELFEHLCAANANL